MAVFLVDGKFHKETVCSYDLCCCTVYFCEGVSSFWRETRGFLLTSARVSLHFGQRREGLSSLRRRALFTSVRDARVSVQLGEFLSSLRGETERADGIGLWSGWFVVGFCRVGGLCSRFSGEVVR